MNIPMVSILMTVAILQLEDLEGVTPSLGDYLTTGRVIGVLAELGVALAVVYGITAALRFLGGRVPRARFFFNRLEPIARVAVWFVAMLVVLQTLAPNNGTFLAGLGSIAIALGLGAQDMIRNLLGGIVVLTDRPFQLGDRVRVGEAYGEIDHIGLISTKLTTPDDTRVTIPNSQILSNQVYNANSGVPDCQVVTDVYLPAGIDPDEASSIGEEVALASPYLLVSKPVTVLIADQFDQRPYTRLRIKAYVHDHRFEPRMQSDITIRAKREFIRRGLLHEDGDARKPSPRSGLQLL
jgi:small-conductance mechanosensitive channel